MLSVISLVALAVLLAVHEGVVANRRVESVSRHAVAGASSGGELAVLVGVLDPRPRVIIGHGYGGLMGAGHEFFAESAVRFLANWL